MILLIDIHSQILERGILKAIEASKQTRAGEILYCRFLPICKSRNPLTGDHATDSDDPTPDSVHHNTGSSDPAHD